MDYRKIKKADFGQLVQLWELLIQGHTLLEPALYKLGEGAEKKQREYFSKFVNSKDKFFMGCFDGKKLVGYVMGRVEDRPPILTVKKMGQLSELAVLPEYRKQGVGKELSQLFFDWCKTRGLGYVQVRVLEKNLAVSFYSKIGFKDFMKEMMLELK